MWERISRKTYIHAYNNHNYKKYTLNSLREQNIRYRSAYTCGWWSIVYQ